MKQKNRSEKVSVWQSLTRHMLGLILGGGILFFLWGINDSYQIYSQGQFHFERYQKLVVTTQEVLRKEKPLKALVPQNFLNPTDLSGIRLSEGRSELLSPPGKDFVLPQAQYQQDDYKPLPYKGTKQLVFQPLDTLKRAQGAHIQLRKEDLVASINRAPKINFNPVGWHNYKFSYQWEEEMGEAWLMQRGHLVGYQFCGINDEGRNLVPETAWMNAGAYKGMNDQNQESQLYIENQLAQWLRVHPSSWLDLDVRPLYKGDNLIPDRIQLTFIGLDKASKQIPIRIPTRFGVELDNGAERVVLKNYSPNAILNYKTGEALPR